MSSTRALRLLPLAAAAFALTVGGIACKKKEDEKKPEPAAEKPAAATEAVAPVGKNVDPPAEKPVLSELGILELLPESTAILVAADGVAPMAARLGVERLKEKFPEGWGKAAAKVKELTGHDLLNPERLSDIGIDPNAPIGFAAIDLAEDTFAVFATLTDAKKLETMLQSVAALAKKELERVELAPGAVLIHPKEDPEVALLIRGEHAMIVMSDHRSDDRLTPYRTLAKVTKKDSLATRKGFARVMKELGSGQALAGYLSVPTIMAQVDKRRSGSDWSVAKRIEKRTALIAKAKAAKAPAQEIARLEEDLLRLRSREKRVQGQRGLFEKLLGGLTIAGGLRFGAKSLTGEVRITMDEGALATGLLKSDPTIPLILRNTAKEPLLLYTVRLDVPRAVRTVKKLLADAGVDASALEGGAMKLLNFDLERDAGKYFTGELGFAVVGEITKPAPGQPASPETLFANIDGHVAVGLGDPKAGKLAMAMLKLFKLLEGTGDEQFVTIGVKKLYVGLAGKHMVASTQKEFIARLAAHKPESFTAKAEPKARRQLLTRADTAGLLTLDPKALAWLTLMKSERAHPTLPAPTDPAMKKKWDELQALRKQIDGARAAAEKAENALVEKIAAYMGTGALQVSAGADGYVLRGGWFLGASVPEIVESIVGAQMLGKDSATSREKELRKLQEKAWELRRELRQSGRRSK